MRVSNFIGSLSKPVYRFNYSVGTTTTAAGVINLIISVINSDDIRYSAMASSMVLMGSINLLLGRWGQIRYRQRQSRNTYLENSYQNGF